VLALLAVALVLEPVLRSRPVRGGEPQLDPDEPTPVERRKLQALAALKEIEFDRATGKLSDADYSHLRDRYTREALEAIRAAEEAGSLVGAAGGNGSGRSPAVPLSAPAATASGLASSAAGEDPVERLIAEAREKGRGRKYCMECGALLVGSGRFCVECGAPAPAPAPPGR
jgi:hypothetical protein